MRYNIRQNFLLLVGLFTVRWQVRHLSSIGTKEKENKIKGLCVWRDRLALHLLTTLTLAYGSCVLYFLHREESFVV